MADALAEASDGCSCAAWKANVGKVNAPFMLAAARNPSQHGYDGEPFHYCPWCGVGLTTAPPTLRCGRERWCVLDHGHGGCCSLGTFEMAATQALFHGDITKLVRLLRDEYPEEGQRGDDEGWNTDETAARLIRSLFTRLSTTSASLTAERALLDRTYQITAHGLPLPLTGRQLLANMALAEDAQGRPEVDAVDPVSEANGVLVHPSSVSSDTATASRATLRPDGGGTT